ncbi:transmembrane protease serine 9-like [Anticarsia gemmatalis]|uniref:transmembrane protease serine 9-like n=1 Tax=Anticarsia gemmatalis TaxID=129554 RepID=UPI003F767F7E
MRVIVLLALCCAAVSADPLNVERIVGGSVTNINNYPGMAAILEAPNFRHTCGGSILNQRSIMTAAHCFRSTATSQYRVRVGSTNSNSGGTVHNINRILIHPNYQIVDSDIALIRTASNIVYSNSVQASRIAGSNYNLRDNEVVWVAGWGAIHSGGPWSEQLRHVQVWTVNQNVCRQRISAITDNMLCAGWLDVGGRDSCQGDSGGPLYHNRVVVGVTSFGSGCADPRFPGVYVRVSRFASWVQNNALKTKMRLFLVLALCCAAVSAGPDSQRIVGGSITSINNYPSIVTILYSVNPNLFSQSCGGTILNQRSIMTAASCVRPDNIINYRIRAGSSNANSGGTVYSLSAAFNHPNSGLMDFDVAVLRTAGSIVYNNVVQPASISGPNYIVGDNEVVWTAGWGSTAVNGPFSEELRHVQVWTINQSVCAERIQALTDNMLCAGWLDVGGRDACSGDTGGPLYHHGVVVGISSFGIGCGDPQYPGVYTRVSRFTSWIQAHA